MTLEEQIKIIERYSEEAYYALFEFLRTHKAEIMAGMVPGLVAGFEQYADITWRRSHEEIQVELLAEMRDAAVYAAIDLHNRDRAFIKWGD